ncbi:formate dehydrogenase subunit delta [Aquisediminimonas sediminicola]|uniref:formate dehydrogenase subunit delta n=1 Tax=Alteraquisediminimonas sediminicola TaxID=2676787 RepID=UPI001C8DE0A1|nr:formate dehydrogenase subunit delta [Aquisediminimonas sediminicola]
MTHLEKLVMMANQIAQNLTHEPDPAAAVAAHIRLFWDPRMRAMICAEEVGGLIPTAKAAVALIRPAA